MTTPGFQTVGFTAGAGITAKAPARLFRASTAGVLAAAVGALSLLTPAAADAATSSASSMAHGFITLTNTSSTASATVTAKKTGSYSVLTQGSATGTLSESIGGLSVPYFFNASSGQGATSDGNFSETLSPGETLTIDLGVSLEGIATSNAPTAATSDVSLASTFSIANDATSAATFSVTFRPTVLYGLSVTGAGPSGSFASLSLANTTTGDSFSDSITGGSKFPLPFSGPETTLAQLAPGQSLDIAATFSVAAQAAVVPEPSTLHLLLVSPLSLLGLRWLRRRRG